MTALLDIPESRSSKTFHLKRWEEVYRDPELRKLSGKIETNRYGQIVMMPPPGFEHSNRQFDIGYQLKTRMLGGHVMTECAVLTADGVKGVDAAWASAARVKKGLKGNVLTLAPEICVEVFSPGNTQEEMAAKRALYFESGADEVWFCDRKGAMHFYLKAVPDKPAKASALCPTMPKKIEA
jgi:Uma2 family endonuclease